MWKIFQYAITYYKIFFIDASMSNFWTCLTDKAIKIQENWKILNKKSPFTQNFAKQPNFFFPKVLIIIFNP